MTFHLHLIASFGAVVLGAKALITVLALIGG